MELLTEIKNALTEHGLNLAGSAAAVEYNRLVDTRFRLSTLYPRVQSYIVIGSGGRAFWQKYKAQCATRTQGITKTKHPLDQYTKRLIESTLSPLLKRLEFRYRFVFPFEFFTGVPLSFAHLANAANLSAPSNLGIQIHQEYGPWIAFRCVILLETRLPLRTAPEGPTFSPCPNCPGRPCILACPAKAITAHEGQNYDKCSEHRLGSLTNCIERCDARYACIYGQEHRYTTDQLRFHQQASLSSIQTRENGITIEDQQDQ